MTNETRQPSDEQIAIALAHLSMLAQAASGEFKPRAGEVEARQAWLVKFIRTGQGIVTEEDCNLARLINSTLSTQSGMLSTQSDAA